MFTFFTDFLGSMNNSSSGHSLRKWLAVGFFWLSAYIVIKFTNESNFTTALTILTGMITALIVTYSVSNHQALKLQMNSKNNINSPDIIPEAK